jgi:hypothetical protein
LGKKPEKKYKKFWEVGLYMRQTGKRDRVGGSSSDPGGVRGLSVKRMLFLYVLFFLTWREFRRTGHTKNDTK